MDFSFEEFSRNNDQSFIVKRSSYYHALNSFHFHTELELLYVMEGEGTLLIGDEFFELTGGELILIGCNTPHMLKFEKQKYFKPLMRQGIIPLNTDLKMLHFDPQLLGASFLKLPENRLLNKLLNDAKRGLMIHNEAKLQTLDILDKLTAAQSHEGLFLLLQLMSILAAHEHKKLNNKPGKRTGINKADETRLTKIYLYTLNNFHRVIKLKEIADLVYMVPNAFCYYFKQKTNKSYFEFLMEIRIEHACKLLAENDYSVIVVCYQSGFSNLSNFNRHFKAITGKTPMEYRKQFLL